jgi:hypothetical protein
MVRSPKFLVLTAVFVIFLTACRSVPPPKPPFLATDVLWSGQPKRGVFLRIGPRQGGTWHLDVWDREGRPLASGAFRLRGFARADFGPEEVLGWENGALQLKDGSWLVPEPR